MSTTDRSEESGLPTPAQEMMRLTADDLGRILAGLDRESTETLKSLAGIRVREPFIRGGMVELLRVKLRNRPPAVRGQVLAILARSVVDRAIELLGDHASDPDRDQLTAAVGPLVDEFGPRPVRLAFAFGVVDEFTAAPHLADLLRTDERLADADTAPEDGATAPPPGSEAEPNAESSTEESTDDLPEEERALFSGLDRLLIATAVATHNGQIGAPPPDELAQIVEEVVALNASRVESNFHLGFLQGLGQEVREPSEAGVNEQRRRWFAFGKMSGLARRGDLTGLAESALAQRDVTTGLVTDPEMGGSLTAPIVRSLLASHPVLAADLLDRRQTVFSGAGELFTDTYTVARTLLSANRPTEAAALFEALDGWAHDLATHVDLRRRLASCRRAMNDFMGAEAVLDDADLPELSPKLLGLLETERGLIAAKVDHLGRIRFPESSNEKEQIAARFEPAEDWFRHAVSHNEADERANCCLGVLAWCRSDHDEAAVLLERAEAAMQDDELYRTTGLLAAVRFHRALALLLTLQPGTDGPCYKAMGDALDEGYRPTDDELVEAVVAFQAHESSHTDRFVERALGLVRDRNRLRRSVAALARQGRQEMLGIAGKLAADGGSGLTCGERFDILAAMVEGASRAHDFDLLEALPDRVGDLLAEAADCALDARYLELLDESEHLREALGAVEAELTAIDLLARTGRVDEAVERGIRLFHRAAAGDLPGYQGEPLLELLRDLGANDEQLDICERRLRQRDVACADEIATRDRPIRIAFVGGDERQAQYRESIDQELHDRYGDKVSVDWYFPGWGTKWLPVAERVESAFWQTDALVLMQFVRTNMGRRLRRTSGENNVPWIACPGHGRAAITAAIEGAVDVVARASGPAR